MSAAPHRHLFTVEDYYRMAETAILAPDARVELIEGEIIEMSPIGSRHAAVVTRLSRLLTTAQGNTAQIRVQQPVRLGLHTEPEPDIAVVRARTDDYASAHPQATDVLLLIEVADSSLDYDRNRKAPLYARHGIPELWVVDLAAAQIWVHREPGRQGYGSVRTVAAGAALTPVRLPEVRIPVDAALGIDA